MSSANYSVDISDSAEMLISVFDTRVSAYNVGNAIIMDGVEKYLRECFPKSFFIFLPYLDSIGLQSIKHLRKSDFIFFGGTNCLSSDFRAYKQWGVDRTNVKFIKDVILMGVGWWQYQSLPTWYTRRLLGNVLHAELLHSVRDHYTANMLRNIGFQNVLVTGCPSMWMLTPEHCAGIPQYKSENVLVTLTDYNQARKLDFDFARELARHYNKLYFWCQGAGDYQYIKSSGVVVETLAPTLQELDQLLNSSLDIDYVGTRLHAGIRALQFRRRSIIIAIDNRAAEKGKDFNLPVIARGDLQSIVKTIKGSFQTAVRIPIDEINAWRAQFRHWRVGVD